MRFGDIGSVRSPAGWVAGSPELTTERTARLIAFSRASLDGSLLFLAILSLAGAMMTMSAVRRAHEAPRPLLQDYVELMMTLTAALLVTALSGFLGDVILSTLCLVGGLIAALRCALPRLSLAGSLAMATRIALLAVGTAWSGLFLSELDLPSGLETAAYVGLGLSVIFAGVGLVENFAREALLTHAVWRRPVAPSRRGAAKGPKVSLQLPCYAEPPEIVKVTMDRLAALDYDNFEVLVCDNNTQDEALWRPLEEHCKALNRRLGRQAFRFFHVSPLPGAKAGALNFLLDHMAPDAELIGVIDADYFSKPDFLSRLVPCFDDPRVGYVQTPHDYRGYEGSAYLTACYWEYMPTNKVDYGGISEYGGAFTIGTMCVLRTEALRKAGGWAEWCLTEDSEVSVRLRAAGYHGYYFTETFGRGLIPETFDDYRKQRFRWTAGPVQQLRRHWRLFLPVPFAAPLPGWTKLLEITRCVSPLTRLAAVITGLVGTIAMGVSLATGAMEPVDVPDVAWAMIAMGLLTGLVQTVHRYRLSGCSNPLDMIRGEVARASLTWVVLVAGVAGLSSKPLAWRRTPKFAVEGADASALRETMPEVICGTVFGVLALLVLLSAELWGGEIAVLMASGLLAMAASFFCAPIMAAMAIGHANRAATKARSTTALQPRIATAPASSSSAKAA